MRPDDEDLELLGRFGCAVVGVASIALMTAFVLGLAWRLFGVMAG